MYRSLLALIAAPIFSAFAQDPTVAFPHNYKIVDDDPEMTVMRVHYGPHEKVGVHDHSAYSTVYVYLNNSGPVRFNHDEEAHPFDLNRPPTHAGAFRVSPGRIERHSVENLSDTPSDYMRIELKQYPAGTIAKGFRGAAPQQPLVPGTTVAYSSPQLRIERIICPSNGGCTLPQEAHGSIAIRIPNHALTEAQAEQAFNIAGGEEDYSYGYIPWRKGWNFNGDGTGPYQVLRITVLPPSHSGANGIPRH